MPSVKIDKKWLLKFIEEEQSSYQHRINSIEEETIKLNNKKNKTKSDIEQLKRLNNDFYWYDGRFAALTKLKDRVKLLEEYKAPETEVIENGSIKKCSNCNEVIRFPHWEFCPSCGKKLIQT